MKLKLCKDKECLNYGIAIPESEFPRNRSYEHKGTRDGLNIYCKACSRRRTREYRLNLMLLIERTKCKLPATAFQQRARL